MSEESDEEELAYVPPEEWVRYMAIFHRSLAATHRYFRTRDNEGIWLAAIIADRLHNVPAMLEHYDESFWHSPSGMDASMRAFPYRIREWRGSRRIVEECREIFSSEFKRDLESLGIREEEYAPPAAPMRKVLLNCLYQGCLQLRRGMTFRRPFFHNPFRRWEREQRVYKAAIATRLAPVPLLLVHWSEEDGNKCLEIMERVPPELPNAFRDDWQCFVARNLKS